MEEYLFKFDLPPVDERKVTCSWIAIGLYPLKKWIKDPDYFICYRVGRDMRIMAIVFGLISFLLSLLMKQWGLQYFKEESLLDIYAFFIIFSGPLMTGSLIYYYKWFDRHRDFNRYDFVRWNKWKISVSDKKIYIFSLSLSFLIGLFPNSIRYFFYSTKFNEYFHQFFDDPIFVLFAAFLTAFIHSMFIKGVFMSALTIKYINHKKNENE